MAPSDFAKADVKSIAEQLTLEEAIALTAGVGFWHTHGIPRLGVPPIKVSTESIFAKRGLTYPSRLAMGPTVSTFYRPLNRSLLTCIRLSGVRGNHFFMGTPAKCLPVCPTTHPLTSSIFTICALFQSSTALGATWDPELVEIVGAKLLAPEAKLRAASVILAPTCNIQRVRIEF